MEERAEGFQKIAATRDAQQLPPGTAIGMAIGAEIARAHPAAIGTTGVGTKVHGGIHRPGASVRGGYRIRPSRRRWSRLTSLLFTPRTVRLVRQARKGFGLAGAVALGLDGSAWPCGYR